MPTQAYRVSRLVTKRYGLSPGGLVPLRDAGRFAPVEANSNDAAYAYTVPGGQTYGLSLRRRAGRSYTFLPHTHASQITKSHGRIDRRAFAGGLKRRGYGSFYLRIA